MAYAEPIVGETSLTTSLLVKPGMHQGRGHVHAPARSWGYPFTAVCCWVMDRALGRSLRRALADGRPMIAKHSAISLQKAHEGYTVQLGSDVVWVLSQRFANFANMEGPRQRAICEMLGQIGEKCVTIRYSGPKKMLPPCNRWIKARQRDPDLLSRTMPGVLSQCAFGTMGAIIYRGDSGC